MLESEPVLQGPAPYCTVLYCTVLQGPAQLPVECVMYTIECTLAGVFFVVFSVCVVCSV